MTREYYDQALAALEDAHKACFRHPDRPLLGMSYGPFSGVNTALGIVAQLEESLAEANEEIAFLKEELRKRLNG